jgi:Mn2+/Fe2+ NRAMP family transporter
VHDKLLAKLKRRIDKLRVGHPLDKNIDMGALVDESQYTTIKSFVDNAVAEGADVYVAPRARAQQRLVLAAHHHLERAAGKSFVSLFALFVCCRSVFAHVLDALQGGHSFECVAVQFHIPSEIRFLSVFACC